MLPVISLVAGSVSFAGFCVLYWFAVERRQSWARLTEAEHAFWLRRGLPVQWAGACKKFQHSLGFKILVAVGAVLAALLFVSAGTFLLISLHRHG